MRIIPTKAGVRRPPHRRPWWPAALALPLTLLLPTSCGRSAASVGGATRVVVVAAENFWGSIAAQIGGAHAQVASLISNPDTDPHAYEPTAQDARSVAQAHYVIVNGAGYDSWADKLVDANPADGRSVLSVAAVAGRKEGDNPHMWYSPAIVREVVDQVTSDLQRIDPADASYFAQQRRSLVTTAFSRYDDLRATIRQRYTGAAVGATESIFVDLAHDLGLDLVSPPGYMRAIAEGSDPSAQDRATFDQQISTNGIRVLVYNRQNSTTDVQTLIDRATGHGIPVVAITETLDPATARFEDWQAGQLQTLADVLGRAAPR